MDKLLSHGQIRRYRSLITNMVFWEKTMKALEVERGDKWLPGIASSRTAERGKPLFLEFEERLW